MHMASRSNPHVFGYFWILNFFFLDSNFFPFTRSLFKSNSTVHAHPNASSWIYSRETRPTLCAAILVYSSVRDWKRFCYVIGSKLSGFTVYDILSDSLIISYHGFIFFHARGVDLKISGFAARVAGCVWTEAVSMQKEKVVYSKISGYA